MILTYKIKHDRDFSVELGKAKKIAEFAVQNKTISSKDVKQFGLKSVISNQILRKYARNRNIKQVRNVNLTIPNQGIKFDKAHKTIQIPSLKLLLTYQFPNNFEKINQIEINSEYIFVSVTILDKPQIQTNNWIGVDLNTTGHVAVVANPDTGKVLKLGKKAEHIHKKYKNTRKQMQKKGKYKKVKQIKNRESRIVRDLNHKISKKIVETAKATNSGIKLEKLTDIRKTTKQRKSFRYALNSWSFYQLQEFIKYKAKLQGIPVAYIAPAYTSQKCSRCGLIGNRQDKIFKCEACKHVDHADSNAAFNISKAGILESVDQLHKDRDLCKASTDTAKGATVKMLSTLEPAQL